MKKHLVPRRISPSLMAETRNMLSGIAPVETYAAGRILLSDDSQSRWVYWLDQGLVKLTSLDSRGCEGIVGVRGPGAFLGETSTLIEERDSVTPVTLTECQLNRIPAKMFLNLLRTNAKFSLIVAQAQAWEIHDQLKQITGLRLLSARERLEHFLFEYASPSRAGAGAVMKLNLPLTRIEIAQILSITPEHLSRLLSNMEREGLIRREKAWILIPDLERLATSVGAE